MYHKTCYRSYVRHYKCMCVVSPFSECAAMDSLSLEDHIPTDTKNVRAAHNASFQYFCICGTAMQSKNVTKVIS